MRIVILDAVNASEPQDFCEDYLLAKDGAGLQPKLCKSIKRIPIVVLHYVVPMAAVHKPLSRRLQFRSASVLVLPYSFTKVTRLLPGVV